MDLDDIIETWMTVGKDFTYDMLATGGMTEISLFIGKLGLVGIIIDLASLAGGVILGDSLSTRLKNWVSVNISTCISLFATKYINKGKYKLDADAFLYQSEESERIANENIVNLGDLLSKYAFY